MSSLSACLKKAGSNISDDDKTLLKEISGDYRGDGMSASDAAMKAVDDVMDIALADRAELVKQITAKGGRVPDLPSVETGTQPVAAVAQDKETPQSIQDDAARIEKDETHKAAPEDYHFDEAVSAYSHSSRSPKYQQRCTGTLSPRQSTAPSKICGRLPKRMSKRKCCD